MPKDVSGFDPQNKEPTREISNEYLNFVEREREASQAEVNRLLSEQKFRQMYMATLVHDLRTPISAVKMGFDLLKDELVIPPSSAELLSLIERNLAKASDMLQELLDGHQITTDSKLCLRIHRCNLASIAQDAIDDLTPMYGRRFELRLTGRGPLVGYWNESTVRRVIINLASNGAKYGFSNTPVTISVTQHGDQTDLEVHNHGTPIAPPDLKLLFELFFRTRTAQELQRHGWGLGLPLVKCIVDAHGGSVTVKSADGEGTRFRVTLPNDARPYQKLLNG